MTAVEATQRVLAEHMHKGYDSRAIRCVCGWEAPSKYGVDPFIAHRAHVAEALAPVFREAEAAAWDEGHRLTRPHSDLCEPTCPNPYRADALGEA